MHERKSGILIHITSLPSRFGIGDLGPEAHRFADFLSDAGQKVWQILPLSPVIIGKGNSPYNSTSAFAANPLLISPELLVKEGLLEKTDIRSVPVFPEDRVDYGAAAGFKQGLLEKACSKFRAAGVLTEFNRFCDENKKWLDGYSLFTALKKKHEGLPWWKWPPKLRDRDPEALASAQVELEEAVFFEKFIQWMFSKQWFAFKEYCNRRDIRIFGDVPIYVQRDSVDVWTHPELFYLDDRKKPTVVAGVPPDYFSETGQLWGNPIYRWDVLRENGYGWWIDRIGHSLKWFDLIRIDHFRGFVGYWEVPAGEKTAMNGKWVDAPAVDFIGRLKDWFQNLPIVAEDLGVITPDVRAVMERYELPGMKVLLFAFGDDLPTNEYAPHNHIRNCLVYSGTHDNNTVRGWFDKEAKPGDKARLEEYLGKKLDSIGIAWEFVRIGMTSVADTAIFPMQDVLGLGEEARMNLPATVEGNWQWRVTSDRITPELAEKLRRITAITGRVKPVDKSAKRSSKNMQGCLGKTVFPAKV